ncbi:unnamed protein product [Cuscuta campestris]|uniref:Secreted protein n=1 Tax=Cuscuta campestris TaxID=132261 RepID=A0A484LAJ9_9ASTE|nr:unnamed protein product [Cuscuta campestris]
MIHGLIMLSSFCRAILVCCFEALYAAGSMGLIGEEDGLWQNMCFYMMNKELDLIRLLQLLWKIYIEAKSQSWTKCIFRTYS